MSARDGISGRSMKVVKLPPSNQSRATQEREQRQQPIVQDQNQDQLQTRQENRSLKNKDQDPVITNSREGADRFAKICDAYQRHMVPIGCRPLTGFPPYRRKQVVERMREYPKCQSAKWWDGFFEYLADECVEVLASEDRTWRASFDWIVAEENFYRCIEGHFAFTFRDK